MSFKLTVAPKPVAGITVTPVPEDFAKALAVEVPKVQKSADHELTITADSARDAAMYAAHAKNWGLSQEPQLYITKLPNGKRYPEEVARLNIRLMSDVPAENRPGRRTTR
jgi:hypothetical protein